MYEMGFYLAFFCQHCLCIYVYMHMAPFFQRVGISIEKVLQLSISLLPVYYLLLMRAKIARNASSSIDGTYLALSLLHPEHVFL